MVLPPDGLLLSFYGDDFTGSAAVMEVLSFAGLPAVLFLNVPTAEQLASFAGYRAIGVAGVARAKSPDWRAIIMQTVVEDIITEDAPFVLDKKKPAAM